MASSLWQTGLSVSYFPFARATDMAVRSKWRLITEVPTPDDKDDTRDGKRTRKKWKKAGKTQAGKQAGKQSALSRSDLALAEVRRHKSGFLSSGAVAPIGRRRRTPSSQRGPSGEPSAPGARGTHREWVTPLAVKRHHSHGQGRKK